MRCFFRPCSLEISSNSWFKWNLTLQPLMALYLHYRSTYGHQTLQNGDLSWGAQIYKGTWRHLWSHVHTRPRDKQKRLYLYFHRVYDHQTWKDDDLPWRASTLKVTQPFVIMAFNLTGCWYQRKASAPKCLTRHGLILCLKAIVNRVFRTMSNTSDRTFCKNNERISVVCYFCKKLHQRCLTES